MRRPSHSAVLKAWSFDGGSPGRTARMEAVVVVVVGGGVVMRSGTLLLEVERGRIYRDVEGVTN